MPDFLIAFSEPVVDQPTHRKVNRPVTDGLWVSSDTVEHAVFHAARVTTGSGVPTAAYDATGQRVWGEGPDTRVLPPPPQPAIEAPQDRTEVYGA